MRDCRPLLARTLHSLRPGWQHEPSLGKVLLTRLLQDLHTTVADNVAVNAVNHQRFLRLCSCFDAVLEGCKQTTGSELSGNAVEFFIPSMLPVAGQFWSKDVTCYLYQILGSSVEAVLTYCTQPTI